MKIIYKILSVTLLLLLSLNSWSKEQVFTAPIVCEHCVNGILDAMKKRKIEVSAHKYDLTKKTITLEIKDDYKLTKEDKAFIELEAGYMLEDYKSQNPKALKSKK